MKLRNLVKIVEVGARDGLQNERKILGWNEKNRFINYLTKSGIREIESGSFVSSKMVPQMGDSDEVLKNIKRKKGTVYSALVPNIKGLEKALECKSDKINFFTSVSETFSKKNTNCNINESLDRLSQIKQKLDSYNISNYQYIPLRVYISCISGCPYEGNVPINNIVDLVNILYYQYNVDDICLADTIGCGTPDSTQKLLNSIKIPTNKLSVHFHNNNNLALNNIEVCLHAGIRSIDSSVGGLGGCPFAKIASGNVDTLSVVSLCNRLGFNTGISLYNLSLACHYIKHQLSQSN